MFALLLSAIWSMVAWFFRAIVFKAVLYIALFTFISEAIPLLLAFLMGTLNVAGIGSAFSTAAQTAPGLLYFVGLFKLDVGVSMVAAAMMTRFAIRRLPIIG